MNKQLKSTPIEKSNGRYYTPRFIVLNILDLSGYCGVNIIKKHVIDNSCGDGAFLVEIVSRYCEYARIVGLSDEELAYDLGHYIHGIDIDYAECDKCKNNVSFIAQKFNIKDVEWDIKCADAMEVRSFDGKMDFVVGNPPYIRVHNAGNSLQRIKQFSFAQSGMTDFFIVFYEIGIKMLNKNGVLGYITPSSFFNSLAGSYLRDYLIKNNLLEKIVDFKHYQPFTATTYTTIVILKKTKKTDYTYYYHYDEKKHLPYYIDKLIPDEFYIKNNFYFANKSNLDLLKKVFNNLINSDVIVKNGYATLCDNVFINNFEFDSKYIIPVIKASTGICTKIFYPYNRDSKLIPECEIKKDFNLYRYLIEQKASLIKRSCDKENNVCWYAFGRSQAINDTYKNKLTINTLVRSVDDLKIVSAPAGVGVYSGLYIISDTINLERIKNILLSDEFINYVSLLGKYKSGGYYTFSSKDIKAFLDYKLAYNGGILQ